MRIDSNFINTSLPKDLNQDSAEKPPLTGSVDVSVIAGTETMVRTSTTAGANNRVGWVQEGAKPSKNGRNGQAEGNESKLEIFSPK